MWTIEIRMLLLPFVFGAVCAIRYSLRLAKYWGQAKQTGLPYVVVPFNLDSIAWMLFRNLIGRWLAITPFDGGSLPKHTQPVWALHVEDGAHGRLGKAFILVTPSANHAFVKDETINDSMLFMRKEFTDLFKLASM